MFWILQAIWSFLDESFSGQHKSWTRLVVAALVSMVIGLGIVLLVEVLID